MEFEITGMTEVYFTMRVEADCLNDALREAEEKLGGGLTPFCGNGGTDHLLGVYDNRISLEPSCEVEFDQDYEDD